MECDIRDFSIIIVNANFRYMSYFDLEIHLKIWLHFHIYLVKLHQQMAVV
jgi:hypothetical protein